MVRGSTGIPRALKPTFSVITVEQNLGPIKKAADNVELLSKVHGAFGGVRQAFEARLSELNIHNGVE